VVEGNAGDSGAPGDEIEHHVQKNALRGAWRAFSRVARRPVLALLLRQLQNASVEQALQPAMLRRLRWAWANPNSASVEYLSAVGEAAAAAKGPILECGSGISTVVVGVVARRAGNALISLEHSAWWSRNVRWSLKMAGVTEIDYRIRPLRFYDGYDWYDAGALPSDIALVICDGPPATSRSGRYGLMPLLNDHLAADARVFLDDYDRPSEVAVVKRWSDEYGWTLERAYVSAKGQFASLVRSESTKQNGSS
jgi:Methyltransferase domain